MKRSQNGATVAVQVADVNPSSPLDKEESVPLLVFSSLGRFHVPSMDKECKGPSWSHVVPTG